MISAASAAAKARERQQLINSQYGISTKQAPSYIVSSFDFNEESRVCHIDFLESTKYRKIIRYVTQGGVRHPIYGDWNTKTKTIKKTLKLTNEALENLNKCSDELVSQFSYEIVSKMNSEDLYPSWFIVETLHNEMDCDIGECKEHYEGFIRREREVIQQNRIKISDCSGHFKANEHILKSAKKEQTKLTRKRNRALNNKHIILFSILTFGIHAILHSKKRVKKLNEKLEKTSQHIDDLIENGQSLQKQVSDCEKNINKRNNNIAEFEAERDDKIASIRSEYQARISQVDPLPTTVSLAHDSGFVPLKKFAGMTYEKIIGCYVIRNTENGKCYVGQSKDVIKRVTRDHFSGTKVKNIIFAEDYFNSSLEDKNNLFEVKVIKRETKDELDRTEKELIEAFDSFNNGYNGTSGNN